MKTNDHRSMIRHAGYALAAGLALAVPSAPGQEAVPFKSGSDGSYGPLNITETTVLDLPPDGVLHCTTAKVAAGKTLSFRRNAANTPVCLLATGDVIIEGIINVSGEVGVTWGPGGFGGPGGFDGGNTRPGAQAGRGPGGVRAGNQSPGSHAWPGGTGSGPTYGDPLLLTLVGGSGGGQYADSGGSHAGGGGGGALLVASDTLIRVVAPGGIHARGGRGGSDKGNAGSGGAIRLVAPRIEGNGQLWADATDLGTAGLGRVRIDSLNRDLTFNVRAAYGAGANMIARLPNPPDLRIVHAAGTDIPLTALGVVRVILPLGAQNTQPIRIQAKGFRTQVPIRVALYPEQGDPTFVDDVIDNSTGETAVKEVTGAFPVNMPTRVFVWTRPPS